MDIILSKNKGSFPPFPSGFSTYSSYDNRSVKKILTSSNDKNPLMVSLNILLMLGFLIKHIAC